MYRKLMITALGLLLPALAVAGEPGETRMTEQLEAGKQACCGLKLPEGLKGSVVELPGNSYAYLETTLLGDMDGAFGKLTQLGKDQGLFGDDTVFGSLYPTDLAQGVDESTPVHVGFSLAKDVEVAAPLMKGEIAPGTYLMVEHWGDYAELEKTYMQVYMWAAMEQVRLGCPSIETYMTDPETTPVEEWLTLIYFPVDLSKPE